MADQDDQNDPSTRERDRVEPATLVNRTNQSTLLRSGYTLAYDREHDEDVLSVIGRDGTVCLRMTLGKDGPEVEMRTRSFRLAATEELRLDCDRMEINANRQVSIRSASLEHTITGDIHLNAGGLIHSEAHAHRIEARLGDVELRANDDIALDGEQIRLNSPRPAPAPVAWPLLSPGTAQPPTVDDPSLALDKMNEPTPEARPADQLAENQDTASPTRQPRPTDTPD
jgi:hypothetical protein